MSVIATCKNPSRLLKGLTEAIDKRKVVTWRHVTLDGKLWFTHSPKQWDSTAWFKAEVLDGSLKFNIFTAKDQRISNEVFGIFHGRLIEALSGHFSSEITLVVSSPRPDHGDGPVLDAA